MVTVMVMVMVMGVDDGNGDGDGEELPQFRGAVDFCGLVDVVGDGAQPRKADQHDKRRPHPCVHDDDGPRRQIDRPQHLEA